LLALARGMWAWPGWYSWSWDAHRGLVEAIGETLPGSTQQRLSHPLPAGSARHGGHIASSPCVATLVRTIVDQPDTTEVEAQFQRVVDALAGKLPQGWRPPRASPLWPAGLPALPQRSSGARSGVPTL